MSWCSRRERSTMKKRKMRPKTKITTRLSTMITREISCSISNSRISKKQSCYTWGEATPPPFRPNKSKFPKHTSSRWRTPSFNNLNVSPPTSKIKKSTICSRKPKIKSHLSNLTPMLILIEKWLILRKKLGWAKCIKTRLRKLRSRKLYRHAESGRSLIWPLNRKIERIGWEGKAAEVWVEEGHPNPQLLPLEIFSNDYYDLYICCDIHSSIILLLFNKYTQDNSSLVVLLYDNCCCLRVNNQIFPKKI